MLRTRSHNTGHAGTRKKLRMLCVKSKQTHSSERKLKQTKGAHKHLFISPNHLAQRYVAVSA